MKLIRLLEAVACEANINFKWFLYIVFCIGENSGK